MQIYLSESRKLKTKLYKKPTNHSHHPLSCNKGIIYSQALRYNMIISEDHILQEYLDNLTRILLARAYPLHLIIKNIKNALTYNRNNLLWQRTPQTETNIPPNVTPFPDISKLFTVTVHKNWHTIASDTLHSLLSCCPNPYQPIPNPASFTTILSTLHKRIAPHGRIPSSSTHKHLHTPIETFPQWYNHSSYTPPLHQLIFVLWVT